MRRAAFWASVAVAVVPLLVLAGIARLTAPEAQHPWKSGVAADVPDDAPVASLSLHIPDDPLAQRYIGDLDDQRLRFTFSADGGAWLELDGHPAFAGTVTAAHAVFSNTIISFEARIGVDEDAALNVAFLGGPFDQRSVRIHSEA